MRTTIAWFAAALLALGPLSGCADDTDEPAAEPTTGEASEPEPTESEPTTAEPTTDEPTTPEPTASESPTATAPTATPGGANAEAFCTQVAELEAGGDMLSTAESLQGIESLRALAPREVAGDVEIVAGGVQALLGAFQQAGLDPNTVDPNTLTAKQQKAILQFATANGFDEAAVTKAGENIEDWTEANC